MKYITPNNKKGFVFLLAISAVVAVALFSATLSFLNQNFRNQVTNVAYREVAFEMASSVLAGIMAKVYAKPWNDRFFKTNPAESFNNPILNGTYDYFVENSPGKTNQFDVYIKIDLQGKSNLYIWRIEYHDSILDISQNFSKVFFTRKEGEKFPTDAMNTLSAEIDEILQDKKNNQDAALEKTAEIEEINDAKEIAEILGAPYTDFPDPDPENGFDAVRPVAPGGLPPMTIGQPPETEKPSTPKPIQEPEPVQTPPPPPSPEPDPTVELPPAPEPDPTAPPPAEPPPEVVEISTYPFVSQDAWMTQKMDEIAECYENSKELLEQAGNLENRCDYKIAYNYFFGEYGTLAAVSDNAKIFEMYHDAQNFLSDVSGAFPESGAILERAMILNNYLIESEKNFQGMIENSKKAFEKYKTALDKFFEEAESPEDLAEHQRLLERYEDNKKKFEGQLKWDSDILASRKKQWSESLENLQKDCESDQAWSELTK